MFIISELNKTRERESRNTIATQRPHSSSSQDILYQQNTDAFTGKEFLIILSEQISCQDESVQIVPAGAEKERDWPKTQIEMLFAFFSYFFISSSRFIYSYVCPIYVKKYEKNGIRLRTRQDRGKGKVMSSGGQSFELTMHSIQWHCTTILNFVEMFPSFVANRKKQTSCV